ALKTFIQETEREVTIKAPWGNIRALSWGNPSNPPVLLCHGRMDACTSFRPLANLLPDSLFYVSVDLPGNGLSDHLPKGVQYGILDFIPTVLQIKDHFKWNNFTFVGHSMAVMIGKLYNITHPGVISRSVDLDPFPAYFTFKFDDLRPWYRYFYDGFYSEDNYKKINGGLETARKYTYEEVLQLTMKARGLSKEAAEEILERSLVPAGEGLYRLTYDQRNKTITAPPFSADNVKLMYTTLSTPTFSVLAKESIKNGLYSKVPFIMDEKVWPKNNFKFKIVDGGHDVHLENPRCMAEDISKFLLQG
ncbi:serine hydrolase-like protein 2, partial [Achroia grisella]|uniref:serine hydrolase-like protein 2 n=1 Tax=Achroia grisella TaxID=688607 RepID=UPI0027D21678